MRININFAKPSGIMAPYLAILYLSLSIIACMATIILIIATQKINAEKGALEIQLLHYSNSEKHPVVGLPSSEKLLILQKQVKALNSLTGTTGKPLPTLLAILEDLMPDGVWLTNLQYLPREAEMKLLVEADRTELLTDFMDRLERSGYFAQVLLTRQSQHNEGSKNLIQFEIQLRERL
jgi:Tfp pilus assembly protein PilN